MIQNLSVLIECSYGRCPTVAAVCDYIRFIGKMGFKALYLGLTDGYKIKEYPYFNYKRGGYTTEDLRTIDRCGMENGVEVIGSIQTLGHLHFLKRYAVFSDLYDTNEVMLVDDDRVLALNEKMFAAISEGLSSRKIHIGFDEAAGTGSGRYRELHNDPIDRKVLLIRHLNRVVEIARKFGYTCEIWHDMMLDRGTSVLSPAEIKALIPKDVRVYFWDYGQSDENKLREMIDTLRHHCETFGYAGAVLKDDSFTTLNDLALNTLIPQIKVCDEQGVTDFMITTWTNGGGQCSLFATLPAMFVAAEYAQGNYVPGTEPNKEKFKEICGIDFDDLWSLRYLDDPFEKKILTGNRSRWILETDILFGNYDMLLSEGTRERYFALADRYENVDGGRFTIIFRMQAALARVLAIKCSVADKIRVAYAAGDKEALREIRDTDIADLIGYMKDFIKKFNAFWLDDSMSFGLEYNQRMFGGMLARFEYAYDRLTDYIEKGILIDEAEGITLPPSIPEDRNEDNWNDTHISRYMA